MVQLLKTYYIALTGEESNVCTTIQISVLPSGQDTLWYWMVKFSVLVQYLYYNNRRTRDAYNMKSIANSNTDLSITNLRKFLKVRDGFRFSQIYIRI